MFALFAEINDGWMDGYNISGDRCFTAAVVVVVVVVEMNIIKVALSHFGCRTTVQSDSVSVARQVTVHRW